MQFGNGIAACLDIYPDGYSRLRSTSFACLAGKTMTEVVSDLKYFSLL